MKEELIMMIGLASPLYAAYLLNTWELEAKGSEIRGSRNTRLILLLLYIINFSNFTNYNFSQNYQFSFSILIYLF